MHKNTDKAGRAPIKRRRRWIVYSLAFGATAAGIYLLLLASAPSSYAPTAPGAQWSEPAPSDRELTENRIYIPRLHLNLPYNPGEQSLDDGAWHRYPERGNPEGGNFILAGHRFRLGITPNATRSNSHFYHLDKLNTGDFVYADYQGVRYQYEVTKTYKVEPNDTSIEQPSDQTKMTLYTCTLLGPADDRIVVEALLINKNIDPTADLISSR